MKEIVITKTMLSQAEKKVNAFEFNAGIGLSRFGSERERTLFGYLGEQMVMSILDIKHDDDDFNFDLMYRQRKLEVKSISCKFKPPQHFLCTVNSFDLSGVHQQEADYYVFCRILNNKSLGWILGFIGCKDFFKFGTFVQKGSTAFPGQRFDKANATILEINKLKSIELIYNI
jgi:hypothetical protein